ncbi:Molybdopterin-guanine dinucleotide biosynthesis protein MobA [hydrothermal vent metagenome]|uniref:Molybdopterin-guanine dinucleotide biosynthesis protein MobA n=1 Tax=hydrothermal vent metagenome TaxID=652676 RepID=A0A3B0WTD2_9ZZZZ
MISTIQNDITWLILAGGRGQRMNGIDKGLMHWQQKPMIEHVINHLNAPPEKIIISANRNLTEYKHYAQKVISDPLDNFQGPLAGILCAMQTCATPYLLCVPCDSPSPPQNMLENLWECMQSQNRTSAICHDGERLQPLFSLLSCQHKTLLNNFLRQGQRKVHDFISLIDPAICDFSSQQIHFNNFNRPEDLKA